MVILQHRYISMPQNDHFRKLLANQWVAGTRRLRFLLPCSKNRPFSRSTAPRRAFPAGAVDCRAGR